MTVPRYRSKIAEAAAKRGGGSFGDLGPGRLALAEWRTRGLEVPDLRALRTARLGRLRRQLARHDCAGIVIADPINLRYATDAANMQVWCLHNPARYAFVATEGPVILFDFHGCAHLSAHLELIDEVRPARAWYYFNSGARVAEHARRWAAEIAELVREHGGGNRRLAVDKADRAGIAALEAEERLRVQDGQEVMEQARVVKSADEIKAMRCALATCEAAIGVMRAELRPGISEQELWAHLHAENVRHGGEWIETRLLSSGPRTNPWFQECSSRVIRAGDLVGFDTDLIGPYGYCADISRTWLCGEQPPTARQRELFRLARAQIAYNLELVRPGLGFREFSEKAFRLPERYRANRYSVIAHGVGLCDEYPAIYYPEEAEAAAYDGVLEAGMTICLESYIGEPGGPDGVKLEQQILITETGAEVLSTWPLEDPAFG
ncbi:MAG TPA: Xaa-Pro peptidase family protein [Geminicoccaceae bacterium]|nr:Xaa-Pro peptidase family protein [Geminicoccaceae bacterium]